MTQVRDLDYLNDLYAASEDPWHLRSGWYSDRKRSVVLGCLPRARYVKTLELGCEVGELTVGLARRSEAVLGIDPRRHAVAEAHARTAHLSNVQLQQLTVPHQWPGARNFDLVVLNEIGYSMSAAVWAQLCQSVCGGLAQDATVIACHWRHELPDRTLESETLHGMLDSMLGLTKLTHVEDCDFLLDVWTTSQRTVAQLEGLL